MPSHPNTLLLASPYGKVRRLSFHPRRSLAVLSGLLLVQCAALLYGGFRLGEHSEILQRLDTVGTLQRDARIQQAALSASRTEAQESLNALAMRLGDMQAQLARLDTLGARLVRRSRLDGTEFDFSAPPDTGTSAPAATSVADFMTTYDQVAAAVRDRARKLRLLERLLMLRDVNARTTPDGEAVEEGILSSKFGVRRDPFTGRHASHHGIDVAGKPGSNVLAMADGIVVRAGSISGYGKLVELDHGHGYMTRYAHNEKLLVNNGDAVHKGDAIALLGSTGRSTGPHLHLEVLHHGVALDPATLLDGLH